MPFWMKPIKRGDNHLSAPSSSSGSGSGSDDTVTDAFGRYSDARFQRRRSKQKSVDVSSIQQLCADNGTRISMVEIFTVLKDYKHPQGNPGQISYADFLVVLRNARSEHQNNPTTKLAFKALGGSVSSDGESSAITIKKIRESLKKVKDMMINVDSLEDAISSREESDTIDFNEFAIYFCK